jgi:D-sedoheptulose 7-phosphate isomerase
MNIKEIINSSISVKEKILSDNTLLDNIGKAIEICITAYRNNGKVLLCGNGGSAADAQHIAAELSGRFYYDRPPLAAEALHVNSSYLTAVANDYGYNEIYSRLTEAMGSEGDVLIGISTSGNSENVVKALETACNKNIHTIALTGEEGGKLKEIADTCICVPSNDTPRIQEAHILIGHILCEEIEKAIFPQ